MKHRHFNERVFVRASIRVCRRDRFAMMAANICGSEAVAHFDRMWLLCCEREHYRRLRSATPKEAK